VGLYHGGYVGYGTDFKGTLCPAPSKVSRKISTYCAKSDYA